MVEANPSLARSQRQAQRQAIAVQVLCERRAREEIKDQIRRQGKVKLSRVPQREITAMARDRLFEDADNRAKLIAEARPIVDQWTAEGFFGKRAAQRQLERNSQDCTSREALSRSHFCCAKVMIEMELRGDSRLRQGEH
jgi:hypothetical protein